MASPTATKSDWVQTRLDEIRSSSYKIVQGERAADEIKRAASHHLLDSKALTAKKKQLYSHYEAIYDTAWLRFVYLQQSKFNSGEIPAHAHLIRVSTICMEIKQAIFDLLALQARIGLVNGKTHTQVTSLEFQTKALGRIYGFTQLAEKLADFVSEVKIRITQKLDDQAPDSPMKKLYLPIPPICESPIMLLEERIQHSCMTDRDALYVECFSLRDIRHSLQILYALKCDDCAVLLALADTFADSYYRVIQSPTLRDEFSSALLAAFSAARANVWVSLREMHDVDLSATAAAQQSSRTSVSSPSNSGRMSVVSPTSGRVSITAQGNGSNGNGNGNGAPGHSKQESGNLKVFSSASATRTSVSAAPSTTSSAAASATAAGSITATPAASAANSSMHTPTAQTPMNSPMSSPAANQSPPPLLSSSMSHHAPGSMTDPASLRMTPVSLSPSTSPPLGHSVSFNTAVFPEAHSGSPEASASPLAVPTTSPASSPETITAENLDDWVEATNTETPYFYNRRTGVSSWTKPTATATSPQSQTAAAVESTDAAKTGQAEVSSS